MTDAPLYTDNSLAGAKRSAKNSIRNVTGRCVLSLRIMTFAMMMIVAVVPIAIFYKWVDKTSFENEIRQVDENHLIIAKNLSSTLSRYAKDTFAMFEFAVSSVEEYKDLSGYPALLKNYNICYVAILDENNILTTSIQGESRHNKSLPDFRTMEELRELAAENRGEVVVSGLKNVNGDANFFIVQQLDDGRMAIARWSTKFIVELQKTIAFGELGHSMMVDQYGRVVAHPNPEWQRISKDASKLSVVKSMMARETGVMHFYSPPMDADMIAGYTYVPETGWGVMVPQPIRELVDRADAVQRTALYVSIMVVALAAIVGLWFSRLLAAPILSVVRSTREIGDGDLSARVPVMPQYAPCEIRTLAHYFNEMVEDIQTKTERLSETLVNEKELSNQRAELLSEAQRANAVKSQFISTMSHELRTPLTSIRGSLELMEKGVVGDISDKAKRMCSIAISNSKRLQVLIDDLLDLEKLDTGKMVYRNSPVDLNTLVKDAVDANESYADLQNVKFVLHNSSENAVICGDDHRLMQVMANLLSNAAKFSLDGTDVEVSVSADTTTARVSVKDQGIGIAEEDQAKVFEKFVQIDADDTRKFGGTGLGLAITRMIVEHHQGEIGFNSKPGQGSEFWFELPLMQKS